MSETTPILNDLAVARAAVQNATGLNTVCSTCAEPYSPAYRPTHGPAVCSLCLLRAEVRRGEALA